MTVCLPPHPLLGLLLLAIPFLALFGASVLLFAKFSAILHFFRNLQRWEIASMAGMVIVLSALAYGLSPHGPVVYFDEFQHAEATANTIEKLDPHGCCEYRNGECLQGGPMLWPLASHVAALPFWFLASDDNPVRRAFKARTFANILWLGLSPALITLWLLLLFKRPSLAHAGGWLWVFNPILAKLMFSASLMPSAVGLSLMALIALERWRSSEKVLDFLLVTFLLIATIHTRMEMALIAVWLPFRVRTSGTKHLSWLLFFLLIASALPLGFLYSNGAAGGAAGWNETLSQSWTHLLVHLPANLAFLAGSLHVPLLLPLAVVGIICERTNSRTLGLLLTSLGFLLFYSAYHIGRFDPEQSFDGWRYSSMVTLFSSSSRCGRMGSSVANSPFYLAQDSYGDHCCRNDLDSSGTTNLPNGTSSAAFFGRMDATTFRVGKRRGIRSYNPSILHERNRIRTHFLQARYFPSGTWIAINAKP